MLEPNGPLAQSVYWRRRGLAAVGSVLAVVLLAWLIGGLVEADDQHPVQGTADTADVGGGDRPGAVQVTSSRVSAPPSSPGPDDPRGSVTASSPSPTVSPTSTTSPPVVTTTSPAPPPKPPAACPDKVVKVVAAPDVPSYPVGARPLLTLRIVNAGPVACTRDLDRKLREILVLGADGTRLWSSTDCYGPPEPDVRVLAPNTAVEFSVNWAGRTSAPGCPENRKTVPAGKYRVVGKLGTLTGPPTPLTLT
ncbi:hypothetical protein [Actinophytocola sp. NPDC049390]|uniref:hypothetical protein n=1 Tax=Actinophytocola sp. NPDC049390 TaxID=3363894 RepID=UPI0037B753B4